MTLPPLNKLNRCCPDAVQYQDNAQDCLDGADVMAVITEWNEFRALTPAQIGSLMAGKAIVDLRNIYDPAAVMAAGFDYRNIGRAGM